jgi:hypothetical protein
VMLSPIAVSNCFETVGGWDMQRNSTTNSLALTFWSVLPSFARRTPPVNDCAFGSGPFWLFAGALLSGGLGNVSATAVEDESNKRKRRPMTTALEGLGFVNRQRCATRFYEVIEFERIR